MPSVTYKDKLGKKKTVRTAYTKAGKAKAKRIAKSLGGKVAHNKPKRR
jgi:hypothetical protein